MKHWRFWVCLIIALYFGIAAIGPYSGRPR